MQTKAPPGLPQATGNEVIDHSAPQGDEVEPTVRIGLSFPSADAPIEEWRETIAFVREAYAPLHDGGPCAGSDEAVKAADVALYARELAHEHPEDDGVRAAASVALGRLRIEIRRCTERAQKIRRHYDTMGRMNELIRNLRNQARSMKTVRPVERPRSSHRTSQCAVTTRAGMTCASTASPESPGSSGRSGATPPSADEEPPAGRIRLQHSWVVASIGTAPAGSFLADRGEAA